MHTYPLTPQFMLLGKKHRTLKPTLWDVFSLSSIGPRNPLLRTLLNFPVIRCLEFCFEVNNKHKQKKENEVPYFSERKPFPLRHHSITVASRDLTWLPEYTVWAFDICRGLLMYRLLKVNERQLAYLGGGKWPSEVLSAWVYF